MFRLPLLALALLVAATLGCGSGGRSGDGGASGGGAPAEGSKADTRAEEKELADLDRQIEAKEKEVASLRAKASALRTKIAAAKSPKDNVYRTPEELFADMPKDAYPKSGRDAGIERAAARKWMKDNLVGRTIEWTATVTGAGVAGNGPFQVTLATDSNYVYAGISSHLMSTIAWGGDFPLGGQSCQAAVYFGEVYAFSYPWCSAAEAQTLRGLKGKKVTFRAVVYDTYVDDSGRTHVEENGKGVVHEDRVLLTLKVATPSADGFLPEASNPNPKDKK